jgi:hypothetical protein
MEYYFGVQLWVWERTTFLIKKNHEYSWKQIRKSSDWNKQQIKQLKELLRNMHNLL